MRSCSLVGPAPKARRRVATLLVAASVGCSGPGAAGVGSGSGTLDGGAAVDAATAAPDGGEGGDAGGLHGAGLTLRARVRSTLPSPHLGEITVHGDVVYVADSFDGLSTALLTEDGDARFTELRAEETTDPIRRCTTLALHEPSATLYCTSDRTETIRAYDVSSRETPVLDDPVALVLPGLSVRDLFVAGDVLYMACFDRGLWVSSIGPGGELGPASPTAVPGNVRFVAGDEVLVAVTSDRGLFTLAGIGRGGERAGRGRARGTTAGSLGSRRTCRGRSRVGRRGARRRLGRSPRITHRVAPPAVATSADVDGHALVVTTLSGLYVYDLSAGEPRLAGFAMAGLGQHRRGVMLSGRFVDGDLVTSDWQFVERWSVDVRGDPTLPEVSQGVYVSPDGVARIPVRNPTPAPLHFALLSGELRRDLDVAAGGTGELELAPDDCAHAIARSPGIYDPLVVVPGPDVVANTRVLVRDPALSAGTRPAPSDVFPRLAIASGGETVFLPDHVRTRVVFHSTDCVAMWPVVEDAAYLARNGRLDGGARLVLVSNDVDVEQSGWAARWQLDGAVLGYVGRYAPSEVLAENGGEGVYERRFELPDLRAAAAHPTDYLVGVDDRIEAVEVVYRGAYPMR